MFSFTFTEFAIGLNDRGNVMDIRKIPALLKENREKDCYINTLLFQESFKSYVENTGSVTKYRGVGKLSYFPIDIDSSNLEESLEALRNLFEVFSLNDVPTMYLRVYFSGSKGFHVMIPNALIGAEPSESISRYMKEFGKLLLDDLLFDSTIYNHVRLFRCPNTKHQKSGLYKIPISYQEALMRPVSYFQELAKEPRLDFNFEKYQGKVNPFLNGLWHQALAGTQSVYSVKTYEESEQYKFPCHRKLFENGSPEGQRNNTALRAAWILKKHSGLTEDLAYKALEEWNKLNKPPLEAKELTKVVEQAYRGNYHFGCSDPIMSLYCDDNCTLLKSRELEEKEVPTLVSVGDMANEYTNFLSMCEKNPVRFFQPIDKYIRGLFPGFVSYIMARSGVGKTSFLIDLIVRMAQAGIKILFFSLEMPQTMIYERLAARILGVPQSDLPEYVKRKEFVYEYEKMKKLLATTLVLTDKPALSIKEMEDYMRFAEERVVGSKIQVVLIDYFGLIRPEHDSDSNYQNKSRMADEIQNFAKRNKVPVVSLLQTNRSGGSDGTQELTLASGRDSGHIEETADFMLGLWMVENSIYAKILKNRYGPNGVTFEALVDRKTNNWLLEEMYSIGSRGGNDVYKNKTER